MIKKNEARLFRMLKEGARRRYGKTRSKQLVPALRETAKALRGSETPDLALEDEPAFFFQSTQTQ